MVCSILKFVPVYEHLFEFLVVHSKKDLRKALEEIGQPVSEAQLRDLIAEVDVNQNSTIEEEEFLIVSNTRSHDLPIYV